jgi:hypothetical protein
MMTPDQANTTVSDQDPKLVAALRTLKAKLEALPEPLRGPFIVEGLAPYAPIRATADVTEAMVERAAAELLAHGEFGTSDVASRRNATVAARAALIAALNPPTGR